MFRNLAVAGVVIGALACAAEAAPVSAKIESVAWRGGYRYRSYPASRNHSYNGNRGSSGRTSALDYPPSSQPYATRIHQWNKYPNQPFYLRGERRSLGILP